MAAPVCAVTGVGPGNGAAFARRFAEAGYAVAMLARSAEALARFESEIPGARAFPADVADAASVEQAFERVRGELGPVEVLLHNAGSGIFGGFDQVEAETLEQAWRVNALGLFHCAKQVVPDMRRAGGGAILVSGATAALRGGAAFAAFAQAKAAQRSLAQSLARSLGPEGIHVAYVIIDGVVDIPRARKLFGDKPDDFFLRPDAIADTMLHLARQDRSAWSFEVDLRPFGEKW